MNKLKIGKNTTQFANQAWARNGDSIISGEALILGLLMHTHSNNRSGSDFKAIQALMGDLNYQGE